MFKELCKYLNKPIIYAPSTSAFWDDEHISKKMLEAHLNPSWDAATRNHLFVDKSAQWISKLVPPSQYKYLLDLGCGPGLYAERFNKAGYIVTGIDFSKRSIAYAKEQASINKSNIEYYYKNYLTIDYKEKYDVATLIYCDYAALSFKDRVTLLKKTREALKPGGKLIFDVFTPVIRRAESQTWNYNEHGGFYTEKPHLCIESVHQYEEDGTELRQSIVVTEDNVNCYNVWDHFFTTENLEAEIRSAGFNQIEFYGDVAGAELSKESETICAVVTK